ncbi:MAG: PEP-CTERM sorting domain-containing protein [bacterium]|nr:PEP-CTERM sorting domain-containing protein [bacterium]
MKKLMALIIFCVVSGWYSQGYSLTVNMFGTISYVDDSDNVLGGVIAVGDTFTGNYTYDFTPDLEAHSSDTSHYTFTSGMNGLRIVINGIEFKSDVSNLDFLIEIVNDRLNKDAVSMISYSNLVSTGLVADTISWQITDASHTAFSNTDLPTTALDPADFPDHPSPNLSIFKTLLTHSGDYSYIILGNVTFTETASIPEPASLILFIIGLAGLVRRKLQK